MIQEWAQTLFLKQFKKLVEAVSARHSRRHQSNRSTAHSLLEQKVCLNRKQESTREWTERSFESSKWSLNSYATLFEVRVQKPLNGRWMQLLGKLRCCICPGAEYSEAVLVENPCDYLKSAVQQWGNLGSFQSCKAWNYNRRAIPSISMPQWPPLSFPPQEKHKLL